MCMQGTGKYKLGFEGKLEMKIFVISEILKSIEGVINALCR